MPTDASGDRTQSQGGSDSVADRLAEHSDRILERVHRTTPDNTERFKLAVKIAFSVALTLLLVYWALAYQYDVVWFEF